MAALWVCRTKAGRLRSDTRLLLLTEIEAWRQKRPRVLLLMPFQSRRSKWWMLIPLVRLALQRGCWRRSGCRRLARPTTLMKAKSGIGALPGKTSNVGLRYQCVLDRLHLVKVNDDWSRITRE